MPLNHKPRSLGTIRRWIKPISLVILLSLLFSGCIGTPAMLRPASESAAKVSNLTWAILAIAAFVFVVVEALLLFATFRFRRRENSELPKQITGNVPLEIGWTAFPAVVLAIVFALTLGTLFSISTPPAIAQNAPAADPTKALHIRVIGHQWWWEFQYPDQKIITAGEMHIPANATIYLDLESNDVIHSFWIPELGGKTDAMPGRINHAWYKSSQPGRYGGQCAEFCGQEHALMKMQVIVDPPEQFLAWIKQQQAPIPEATGEAAVGQQMFLSSSCPACHAINGTKANGQVGPNLTHFASRQRFAGDSFDNTHANVSEWIQFPREMKPGTIMPDLGSMPNMGSTIATFLETLK